MKSQTSISYDYVIDSFAWVEYFRGSPAGLKARPVIEGGSAATCSITPAELREKYLRERWQSFEEDLNFIANHSTLIAVDRKIAVLAGAINHQQKKRTKDWGMVDSLILATARVANAKVLTGDPHFSGLSDALIIQ